MAADIDWPQLLGRDLMPGELDGTFNPPTLDIDQPCPGEVGAAVLSLWVIMRGLRDEIAELRGQLAEHLVAPA
jgi:hypothetical protein